MDHREPRTRLHTPRRSRPRPRPRLVGRRRPRLPGHAILQPATIAFSHADSPIALLAWIYEKVIAWSDEYPWTPNEILTWVSLYYFSRAGPEASSYQYYEALHGKEVGMSVVQGYIDFPLGLADFPVEISNAPKTWWGTLGPVVWSKRYEKGGHFAGWERPGDLAAGLCERFGKGGPAEGVVEGRSGYA